MELCHLGFPAFNDNQESLSVYIRRRRIISLIKLQSLKKICCLLNNVINPVEDRSARINKKWITIVHEIITAIMLMFNWNMWLT